MNKAELVKAVAEKVFLPAALVERVVNAVVDVVVKTATTGESVTIRKLGRFTTVRCGQRFRKHPKTGKIFRSAASTVPKFRPAPSFSASVAAKK